MLVELTWLVAGAFSMVGILMFRELAQQFLVRWHRDDDQRSRRE